MKIRQVEYRRLVSFGHFQNETVGVTLEVSDGQAPEDVLSYARQWVMTNLSAVVDIDRARENLQELEWSVTQKQRELDRLQARWTAARAFLQRHGVGTPDVDFNDDELPF